MSDLVQPLEEHELVDEHKKDLKCNRKPLLTEDMEEENLGVPPKSVAGTAEQDNLEYYTFSETNPRFDLVISYSNLRPRYYVVIPPKINKELPKEKVPVVLNSYGKSWTMFYNGHLVVKTLDRDWKPFADDNELKIGDACFFELTENSKSRIVFKVVILRTASFPCDEVEEGDGGTIDAPIVIE